MKTLYLSCISQVYTHLIYCQIYFTSLATGPNIITATIDDDFSVSILIPVPFFRVLHLPVFLWVKCSVARLKEHDIAS